MPLIVRSAALVLALATCAAVNAQTLHNPAGAYDDLPVSSLPADSSPSESLTIVPPSRPPATPPMEGALAPIEPWTPDGPAYIRADAPMSHAIAAEPWDGGWFGAVELTIFRPVFDDLPIVDREGSVAPRLIFGWESDRGFGLRTRFWGLENESQLDLMGVLVDQQLEAFRFDFDLYREFDFKGSSITVGGSITAADIKTSFAPISVAGEESSGGVGVFLEGRHLISKSYDSQWSVLARGRWAGLVGERNSPPNSSTITGDSSIRITEAGLGWEYKRNFDSCSFVLQHMIEVQTWDNYYLGEFSLFGQNVSMGFTF
ncbi:MAG TPA: hypothetical protein VF175_15260 [Lacipirellula sp.]